MRIGWLVNENHLVMTTPFRNGSHLPTTHVQISWILLRNAMTAVAVKKMPFFNVVPCPSKFLAGGLHVQMSKEKETSKIIYSS
jgi:hypothetical protein